MTHFAVGEFAGNAYLLLGDDKVEVVEQTVISVSWRFLFIADTCALLPEGLVKDKAR